MTLLSRRSLLAVATVLDVALHARPEPVSARALAERHGLKPRQLESVLQALVRGGILKGLRGPRGGYEVARERRRVSVGEIVRAVEPVGEPGPGAPPLPFASAIGAALAPAEAALLAGLDAVTLAELCARAEEGLARPPVDFTI